MVSTACSNDSRSTHSVPSSFCRNSVALFRRCFICSLLWLKLLLRLHPTTQPCKYDFTLKPNDHMLITKNSPGLHLHPTTQPCKYDFTLKRNDHMIIKNSPGLHLHPATPPCKYDFALKPNDHMIIKQTHLDFTCIRRLNHANTTSR